MAVVVLENGIPLDRKRRQTFIYAARILKDGTIKIGVSGKLKQRIQAIRNSQKSCIELLGIMPGSLANEQLLHRALSSSRSFREYYHDTPQVQSFIQTYLVPASCYGLNIHCSQQEYVGRPRPYESYQPNPANVARYIDRILASDISQRHIMIRRLVMRISWMKHRPHWQEFVDMMRDRLNVDLAATRPQYRREVVYFADSEVAA